MRTLEVALRLNLPERIADDSETIAVNGRPVKVPCDRLTALTGAFGAGDITITGGDAIDALAMLHEPFPRWMFHLAKHLDLVHFVKPNAPSPLPDSQREAWFEKEEEMPCHIGCNNYYDYYVFGYALPYVIGAHYGRVYLTDEFLSTPRLPDFKTHIPESENARIAYFIHALPNPHAELYQWMLLHQKELVCLLRDLKREYENPLQYIIIYRNPRAVAMRDYRADVALTLGRWYMVGGSELMTALRDQGGLPFMRDAGLSEVGNNA